MEELAIPTDHDPSLIAPIAFEPAFTVTLEYAAPKIFHTPHGNRLFHKVDGGTVSGKITGSVYPNGGGEYSLQREDGVVDVNAHILLRDDTEQAEWIYLRNVGYRRSDGYYRVTSWVDSDVRGTHDWVLGLLFVGIGTPSADGRSIRIDYYEVA